MSFHFESISRANNWVFPEKFFLSMKIFSNKIKYTKLFCHITICCIFHELEKYWVFFLLPLSCLLLARNRNWKVYAANIHLRGAMFSNGFTLRCVYGFFVCFFFIYTISIFYSFKTRVTCRLHCVNVKWSQACVPFCPCIYWDKLN